ncbi:MAG: hypothetical protein ABIJ94_02270, partial [candidate division WOR-3 bacterium]
LLRVIRVSIDHLSPKIGCGKVLASLPVFPASESFLKAMETYGIKIIYADKAAQKYLTDNKFTGPFMSNAATGRTPLDANFKFSFTTPDIILAFDESKASAWFLAESSNKLALENYYRDAVPNIMKSLGLTLTGSTVRLTPYGWQNLFDLFNADFVRAHPEVKRVEVMSVLAGLRWRPPDLGVGITLLNFTEPAKIRNDIEVLLKKSETNGSAKPISK